ncbi:hypothetical protein KAW65_04075 [candidate division WOR-3 bacterium]|nr:hypothetical protein [candidate division WOR-3 bacterium]
MKRKAYLLLLLILIFVGCTQYTYYGSLESKDSQEKMRKHLVYWTKTERIMWFDECSEVVRLLTECSLETVAFKETERDGIIFRCPSKEHKGVDRNVEIGEPCGEILNAKKVKELTDDTLRLVIYCQYVPEDSGFTVGNHSYLKAGTYAFCIVKTKSSEFKGSVPTRPECREK